MPRHDSGSTRERPTVLLVLAACLLASRVAVGVYENYNPPKFPDLVQWTTAAAAETTAQSQKKLILCDFSASWCEPCKKMKREVFADPGAAKVINDNFVAVQVDVDEDTPDVDGLKKKYDIESLPTLVAVGPGRQDSTAIAGYEGKHRTIRSLKDALKKNKASSR